MQLRLSTPDREAFRIDVGDSSTVVWAAQDFGRTGAESWLVHAPLEFVRAHWKTGLTVRCIPLTRDLAVDTYLSSVGGSAPVIGDAETDRRPEDAVPLSFIARVA